MLRPDLWETLPGVLVRARQTGWVFYEKKCDRHKDLDGAEWFAQLHEENKKRQLVQHSVIAQIKPDFDWREASVVYDEKGVLHVKWRPDAKHAPNEDDRGKIRSVLDALYGEGMVVLE